MFAAVAAFLAHAEPAFSQPSRFLTIGNEEVRFGETVDVPVFMTNDADVEGFVTAIVHGPSLLSLQNINSGSAAAAADIAAFRLIQFLAGRLELSWTWPPPAAQTPRIPPGVDQPIAECFYTPTADVLVPTVVPLTLCFEFSKNTRQTSIVACPPNVLGKHI